MENKLLMDKMKNAAELAWAAYGYYDLMTGDTNQLFIKLKNEKENSQIDSNEDFIRKEIALADIMDSTFADYKVYKPQLSPKFKPDVVGTLKGDMSPTQVKLDSKLSNRTITFTNRFRILAHQPNEVRMRGDKNSDGNYGFSATLFQDTQATFKDSDYILQLGLS